MQSNTEKKQVVIFMRHGIARHNLRDPRTGQVADHRDPSLLDPGLVYEGQVMAIRAGHDVQRIQPNIDLLVCSPLTRCIQTTLLAFLPGEKPAPPVLAKEDVREAFGMCYPDKRRSKSHLTVSLEMKEVGTLA